MPDTNNLICCKCDSAFSALVDFQKHLKDYHDLKVSDNVQIICKMCRKEFKWVRYFIKHVKEYHVTPTVHNEPQIKKRKIDNSTWLPKNIDFQSHICDIAANLRFCTDMTATNVGLVVNKVEKMTESIMKEVEIKIQEFFTEHQVNVPDEKLKLFLNQFHYDSSQFMNLKSMKSQISILKNKYNYIDPIDIRLGKEVKFVKGQSSPDVQHIVISYVPVIEIIKMVFSQEEVVNFKKDIKTSKNDILSCFEDGEIYKNHPFFQKYPDGIGIFLYNDDFLANNPIGSKARQQKLGGFYISFMNLPEHLRDFIGNVHPIAITKQEYIKTYGIDECLSAFMLELMSLESDAGVSCTIKNKKFTFRATVVGVIADSLAAHEILGFMSPSSKYFCRICIITRNEWKFFPSVNADIRTKEIHDECITKIKSGDTDNHMGVKRECVLNESKYFHSTQNFIFDIMHDVLEGQAQLDLRLIISKLIVNKTYDLNIECLNYRISNFNYGPLDSKDKPSPILCDTTSNIKLQQRAVQTWCLLRAFPFMVSDKVPKDDPYLQHLININKINEIIFSPKIPSHILSYLEELIDLHIENFQKLFPEQSLINKLMHMKHYPMCIRQCGPLRHLSCFKYEAKHNLFIKYGALCCNYKNISKTMTNIAQMTQCSIWGKDQKYIRERINYSASNDPNEEEIMILKSVLKEEVRIENLRVLLSVSIYSKRYQNGLFLALRIGSDIDSNMPAFGKIMKIILYNDDIYFYCQLYRTLYLNEALNAYKINETDSYELINYECLVDNHALSEWNDFNGQSYICLYHMIVE
uniref:C2H2-type domain-containing protein n=1 Tax=Trichogramma kaykai TaxID=54128 RepID=A0ABD2WN81_9HYME